MASTSTVMLTSDNYFQWRSHMEDLLRSKGMYQITMGTETAPTDDDKKPNGIIGMTKHVD
jgi:hypothetical protein